MRTLAIFTLLFVSVIRSYSTEIVLIATNMALPSPWAYSTSSDSPEGAWVAPLTLQPSISATVTLSAPLAIGNYTVIPKILDYDHGNIFAFSLGGVAGNTQVLNDRDVDTIYWGTNVSMHVSAPTDQLIFTIIRSAFNNPRLFAIYLSSDTNSVVERDDRVMVFRYPGASDANNTPAVAGNRVPNSSFEVGVGPFWRILRSGHTESLADLWSTNSYFGGRSLMLPGVDPSTGTYSVQSLPITLASNKSHTLSCYVRSRDAACRANISLSGFYTTPVNASNAFTVVTSEIIGTSWTRLAVIATNLPYYPSGEYYISLTARSEISGGDQIYFDGLQLEEGIVTNAYAPMYPFEFDVASSEPSQVFWTNDPSATISIRAYNNTASSVTKRVDYGVYNWTNKLVWTGSTNVTASGSNVTVSLSVPLTEYGHFRGSFGITNQDSNTELTWLVVPTPSNTNSFDTNSFFGSHMNADSNVLARAQRMGVKWQRTVSLGRFRWSEVELSDNVFTWPDLSIYTNYGISILGNLGEDTPSWIVPVTDNTNYFWRFVSNAVVRYTNNIKAYEIWNEPDQDGVEVPTMNHYAVLSIQAATAIKAIDPRIQVTGGGGVQTYIQVTNIWALMGTYTNLIDSMSVHEYPSSELATLDIRSNFTAVPVMNSESGSGDKGSYTFARQPFRKSGHYAIEWKAGDVFYDSFALSPEAQAENFLTCIGNKLRQEFYYDGGQRNLEVSDFESRQFSWVDYDDSIRAKGAAIAGYMRLIDKSTNATTITVSNSTITAYGMVAAGVPYVAIWTSASNATAVLNGSVSAADMKIFDLMGNGSVPSSLTINLGRMPVLITSVGGISNLFHAVSNSVVTARADTQAPNLVLVDRPRILRADVPAHYRWFAVDDQDTPSESLTVGIEYRYRTNSATWSDWGGDTWVNYDGMTALPIFEVQARDRAGNIAIAGDGLMTNIIFSITNPLPLTQMVQVVRFVFPTNSYDPDNTALFNEAGTFVPYQRGSSNQVFFHAGLNPNSTNQYFFVSGVAPTNVSGLRGYLGFSTNSAAATPWQYQVTNGLHSGFRTVNPSVASYSNAAPWQGQQLRNGFWINGPTGTNGTNLMYVSAGEDLIAPKLVCWSNMTVTVIDAGPIYTEMVFEGTYLRTEYNYLGSIEQWPDSPGFYRFRWAMGALEPGFEVEPFNNDAVYFRTDASPGATGNQVRYRGHSSTSLINGYLWGFPAEFPTGPYSFDILCDVTMGSTNLASRQKDDQGNTAGFAAASYNFPLFIRDAGVWNLIWATNGAASAPTIGWGNIRQSVGLGGVISANSPRLGYWSTNTGQWGLEFGTQVYADTTTPMALQNARARWFIYSGTNLSVINSSNQPGYIQPEIMPLWARHYALDIDKIRSWNIGWTDSMTPGGFYMDTATVNTNYATPIRGGDTALYNELVASSGSEGDLILKMWLTNSALANATTLSQLIYTADQTFNLYTNWLVADANQASRFNSLQGVVQVLTRSAPVLAAILSDGATVSATVSNQAKAWIAMNGNFVRDGDVTPIDNYVSNVVNLGTQNMPAQYVSARGTFSIGFTNHPIFGTNAFSDYLNSSNTLTTILNAYGASIGSPHYAGASVQPILGNLLEARVRGWTNALYGRLQNHADWNIQNSTPIDPRFGQSELVVFGEGYPSGNGMNGMLAGAFYAGIDDTRASKLLYRWNQEDKPSSDYFFPSFLMTPRNFAQTAYVLTSEQTPGYWSVHRDRSDSTNHSAFWMINGSYYSDHRIAPDTANYNWFPLGVPASVAWGSIYYPQVDSQVFGNIWTDASVFASWTGSNIYSEALTWTEPQGESTNFLGFTRSTWSDAYYTNSTGAARWGRTARTFGFFRNASLLELTDIKNNADNYIWSAFFMSTGAITHPVGQAVPVFITNDVTGARNMPLVAALSGSVDIPLPAGTNSFKFTGVPWVGAASNGNNFLLTTHSPTTNQATFATWSHSYADTTVLNDYLTVNGATRYFEQQQIPRIKGTNNVHALMLAYRKNTVEPIITTNAAGDFVAIQGQEVQIVNTNYSEFSEGSTNRAIVNWTILPMTFTNGITQSGGPTEVMVGQTNFVTAAGTGGRRVITLPANWRNPAPRLFSGGMGINYTSNRSLTITIK